MTYLNTGQIEIQCPGDWLPSTDSFPDYSFLFSHLISLPAFILLQYKENFWKSVIYQLSGTTAVTSNVMNDCSGITDPLRRTQKYETESQELHQSRHTALTHWVAPSHLVWITHSRTVRASPIPLHAIHFIVFIMLENQHIKPMKHRLKEKAHPKMRKTSFWAAEAASWPPIKLHQAPHLVQNSSFHKWDLGQKKRGTNKMVYLLLCKHC